VPILHQELIVLSKALVQRQPSVNHALISVTAFLFPIPICRLQSVKSVSFMTLAMPPHEQLFLMPWFVDIG